MVRLSQIGFHVLVELQADCIAIPEFKPEWKFKKEEIDDWVRSGEASDRRAGHVDD